jgi:peptide/nickel transport system ATP-binding protein
LLNKPVLTVTNLSVAFNSAQGPVNAVRNISLEVLPGETVAIVGESGSGKSVTSLSVMRLLVSSARVNEGSILFTDRSGNTVDLITVDDDTVRNYRGNQVGMIFQEPMTSLNPVMRCGRQVMEGILRHTKCTRKAARERTLKLFSEVMLPSPETAFGKYPHELSGGQKQRIMIAMAIACEPRLLIADEPTTALDVTVQKTILSLLKSLQQKTGMGILFITHDLGVVAEIADKVVVMYKGEIVEKGTVAQIFKTPAHAYTKSLIACKPPLNKRLKRLPVIADFIPATGNETADFVSAGASLLQDVVRPEERRADLAKLYSGKKILEVKNLSTWYPSVRSLFGRTLDHYRVVDDVSFDVYEGETLGLVGESGCGKTTLGRTLLKLAQSSSGKVLFRETDITAMSQKEYRPFRKKMQIIFQDPYSSLNPGLTVGQAIAEPLRFHNIAKTSRQARERVTELLRKVGLDENHYARYPHQFSGGQRQRICIARALAMDPEFIICDESVSALDISVQAQVLNLLNDLKREFKFTCIFISHDLGVVKFMSDRMMVMQKGKILEMGDPDELYLNPRTEYTKTLISSIPAIDKVIN